MAKITLDQGRRLWMNSRKCPMIERWKIGTDHDHHLAMELGLDQVHHLLRAGSQIKKDLDRALRQLISQLLLQQPYPINQ
jgi:hypothetical protein